ncbi:aminoglycoside phosphotransferase family protein [Kribbella sp. NBC_01484]|uniref:aminoglycoside phosphotransferase family protein n=1 Tax=Kribbella sp. NBC_01484 TaxID=2903579 RepID=UPI002E31209E|nr:aminoglycoside phosphotransferase family protein [Kribbella sp. NBC_01484]
MDDELVRTLLQEQHPDLADLELKEVVGGWGNQMWRLGADLAVRMPRTEEGTELLLNEHRWVPDIAARVPLPVQTPVRLGKPSDRFPRTWLVTTWVAGEPADHAPITDPAAADVLADFLLALHIEAPAEAPANDRSSLPRSLGFTEVHEYVGRGEEMRAVWADAIAAPAWDGPPVWLHGDLHPANVVVADGALAGVIDLGEVCAGDPATDLAAAWILLPTGAADRFFERYPADDATVRRARGWAVQRALFLIAMGINGDKGLPGGKPHWGPIGLQALERLL